MIKKIFRRAVSAYQSYILSISLIISAFLIPNDFYGYVLVIVCGILASFLWKRQRLFQKSFL